MTQTGLEIFMGVDALLALMLVFVIVQATINSSLVKRIKVLESIARLKGWSI